jgi:acetyl-CoA synthetase
MATTVEHSRVHHELKASTPESIPKSAIPAAVASPVPAPAATETVSLKSEETQATVKETKVPVVAEAHLVDTYRKLTRSATLGSESIANIPLRPSSAHVC